MPGIDLDPKGRDLLKPLDRAAVEAFTAAMSTPVASSSAEATRKANSITRRYTTRRHTAAWHASRRFWRRPAS